MAHIVHCRICKKAINVDEETDWVKPVKNMYYHKSCYEDFGKKKGAIREGDMTVEADDDLWRSAVYEYLKRDLKISIDFRKFNSQWTSFLKKDMTAKGIYFTLRYFYEIAHGDTSKSENGIGIVPYVYADGTTYWANRNMRDKGICDRIQKQIMQVVEQKSVKLNRKKTEKKKKNTIDLSAIANMEDDE